MSLYSCNRRLRVVTSLHMTVLPLLLGRSFDYIHLVLLPTLVVYVERRLIPFFDHPTSSRRRHLGSLWFLHLSLEILLHQQILLAWKSLWHPRLNGMLFSVVFFFFLQLLLVINRIAEFRDHYII